MKSYRPRTQASCLSLCRCCLTFSQARHQLLDETLFGVIVYGSDQPRSFPDGAWRRICRDELRGTAHTVQTPGRLNNFDAVSPSEPHCMTAHAAAETYVMLTAVRRLRVALYARANLFMRGISEVSAFSRLQNG